MSASNGETKVIHASDVISMEEVHGVGHDNWVDNKIVEPLEYAGAIIVAQRLDLFGRKTNHKDFTNPFTHGYLRIALAADQA